MSRRYFDNTFSEYCEEAAVIYFDKNGVSENFRKKLLEYREKKLNILATDLKSEIFCNGTVYTGSAGLSLYYLMRYINDDKHDEDKLKLAWRFLELRNVKNRRISFICGDAGPMALAAIITNKFDGNGPDNLPDLKLSLQRLMDITSLLDASPDEVLYGAAGYLYALMFVKRNIPANLIHAKYIGRVVDHIIKSGKEFASSVRSDSPLLWEWHEKIYLGAAHGLAGILYLLLQAEPYVNQRDMHNLVKPTLDWLAERQFKSGNFQSSYGSRSEDKLVQWCHGSPGFVHLYVLAHQIFNEERYLQIAIKCGDIIWERGLCTKGYSLCHGVSGNAYSFLCLYQATKDPQHYYRACCFMDWCMSEKSGTEQQVPDRPASLFEGLVGRLCLVEDILNPEKAKFPAFQL